MRILLVDDEVELTEPLRQVLSKEGYTIDVADNGKTGLQLALNHGYDLLILDWMLPYLSGLEICQQLRSQGKTTPVLFLTAKDTLDDRVMGLDVGADDYLIKPFQLRELLARVRALLRRSPTFEANISQERLKAADLELDPENQMAYRHGRGISLSEKEVMLLSYFMLHPGQLLTHEQIYQHLWTEKEQPNSNVLAALVRLLRRKIEADGELPLIHTVYGKGYRFGE
ncbi:two component transcriptional regulator, winged helix family [Gloeothece citriformis PCC 7424]|uniref:Two component transcriptional regulator, winged helix family n=1 Tax=Gloeothece citriformis (strain PCC 7424) TaxID=65393 RepID=B7K7L8_GLOC7|nr:two-component system response regulator RppA [Gloeothece citriformis]ACK69786.1 two component transcriptional regulator, winged helix family [Gloeothece citriformis PCC 7424]